VTGIKATYPCEHGKQHDPDGDSQAEKCYPYALRTPDLEQGRALALELECAAQPLSRALLLEHLPVPT